MDGIPGIKKPRFYEKKWIVECFAIGPPTIVAIVAVLGNFSDPTKKNQLWLLVIAAAWLVVASAMKVGYEHKQDAEEKQKQGYDGLLGALHVLYGIVSRHLNFGDRDFGRLRVTVHRVVPSSVRGDAPRELEQLLPYVGGKGKYPGRKFPIQSGIIGKAARDRTPYVFSRQSDDYEAFIREMVSTWSFTEDDARSLTSDRRAWMAVPIFTRGDNIVGVVYLDSNERDFFGEDVGDLILNACGGIASYITERYK